MLFTGAFIINCWCLTIGNKTSDKLSERARWQGARERKLESNKRREGKIVFCHRSPEAHPENTHDDVSCVTVMMLSFYANVGVASTCKPTISFWFGYHKIISQSKELKSSRLALSLKLTIKRLKTEKNRCNCRRNALLSIQLTVNNYN